VRAVTSESARASCSTSTPSDSAASGSPASGYLVSRPADHRRTDASAGNTSTSRSTTRLAYAELLPGQDAQACVRFLERATRWYQEHGVVVQRVLTDNAKAYHSRAWIESTERLRLQRRYTRIYRPRTNGKAERLIQTLLREWAHARAYPSSSRRARALPSYLRWYNNQRPHSSLGARPPISRVSHLCGQDS
jgi:transposase InsO family protein